MKATLYANGVRSIMYGIVCSITDLIDVVSVVSMYMADPRRAHWKALKWSSLVFRRSTLDRATIKGYVKVDYAGNVDTKKSISRYVFYLVWYYGLLEI